MKATMSKNYILIITLMTFYSINLNCAAAYNEYDEAQETAIKSDLDKLCDLKDVNEFKSVHTREVVETFFEKFMSNFKKQKFSLNRRIQVLEKFLKLIDIKLIRMEDTNTTDVGLYNFVNGLRFNIQNLIDFNQIIRNFLTTNDAEVVTSIFNRFMSDLEKSQQPTEYKINSVEEFIKLFDRKIRKSANGQSNFIDQLNRYKAKLIDLKNNMVAVQARLDASMKQDILNGYL